MGGDKSESLTNDVIRIVTVVYATMQHKLLIRRNKNNLKKLKCLFTYVISNNSYVYNIYVKAIHFIKITVIVYPSNVASPEIYYFYTLKPKHLL